VSLWAYPAQAAFGRVLPKNKIYEHGGANTRLKDLFVKQVEQIVWQYKLAPETLNLPARPGVPEIQVFSLQLKTPELHPDVLRCIDAAVQFPVVFELGHGKRIQVAAAYRRPSEADRSRWVFSDYFATKWLPANAARAPLPVALHLASLYEQLLRSLIPLPMRQQETLAEHAERAALAQAKQREFEKAAARLAKERQFNRKVEINAALRQLKIELEALSL
jgi:hypothetical protein